MKTSKMLDGYPQRSCAAATLPPFARLPPLRAALPRRYADPRSASLRSGDGRPRFGHGPAAGAAWRGLGRGGPSSPLARLRVELARGALARLRLGRCPRRPRGPVPFGQSGPREDRRGSSRRSAALFRPYRYSRVMDRRGGEPREAPRTRLFITLPNRCRFELRTVGGGNGMKVETRVGPATNKPPFQWMDGARFSSRDDAPAAETNTPEDGRVQASTIRLSQVAGSRVPVAKPYGRKTR